MHPIDHSPEGFQSAHPSNNTGAQYPTAACGTGNVIALRDDKGWWALIARRAPHLAHGGSWGLLGGYLDFGENEGPVAASHREIFEESQGVLDLSDTMPTLLTAYIDYLDRYCGQCVALGMFYALDDARAETLRRAIDNSSMENDEMSEFRLLSLTNLEDELATLAAEGGIGYPQEKEFLRCAAAHVTRKKD